MAGSQVCLHRFKKARHSSSGSTMMIKQNSRLPPKVKVLDLIPEEAEVEVGIPRCRILLLLDATLLAAAWLLSLALLCHYFDRVLVVSREDNGVRACSSCGRGGGFAERHGCCSSCYARACRIDRFGQRNPDFRLPDEAETRVRSREAES